MTSDTVRQKYIYDVPFDDNDFPLVKLDAEYKPEFKMYNILASDLWFLEENDFNSLCAKISKHYTGIAIINNFRFNSKNSILIRSSLCYLMSFAYLFKKKGIKCYLRYNFELNVNNY